MNRKELFEKYHSKLMWEAILKSVIYSVIVAFGTNFILSLLSYIIGYEVFWLSIVIAVAVFGLSIPIFYFDKFKPTTKSIAKRVDQLGLEERLITMLELEKDKSFIALKQREDAKRNLSKLNATIKFSIYSAPIIVAGIMVLAGGAMTTVNALAEYGVIPKVSDFSNGVDDENAEYITIYYTVEEGGGYIEGMPTQIVKVGGFTELVMATPDEGYAFQGWSDENTEPARQDIALSEEMTGVKEITFVAKFAEGQGQGEGEGGEGGEEGESKPSDKPTEGEPSDSEDSNGNDDPGDGSGGKHEENNNILNGEEYYRDFYKQYYEKALEDAEAGDLPPELLEIIESYFNTIK